MADIIVDMQEQIVIWVASCSNTKRSVEECQKLTADLLEKIDSASGYRDQFLDDFTGRISLVVLNRDNDVSFINMLLEFKRQEIADRCLETLWIVAQRNTDLDYLSYIADYITLFGETRQVLFYKLRWLTSFDNYASNKAEVEQLLAKLNGTEAE